MKLIALLVSLALVLWSFFPGEEKSLLIKLSLMFIFSLVPKQSEYGLTEEQVAGEHLQMQKYVKLCFVIGSPTNENFALNCFRL